MMRVVFRPLFGNEESQLSLPKVFNQLCDAMRFTEELPRFMEYGCRFSHPMSPVCARKRPLGYSDLEAEGFQHSIQNGKNSHKFVVTFDVRGFKPEELTVKTVEDCVEVSAKHEERSDGSSYEEREFTRRFALTQGVGAETVTCALRPSGVLAIEASRPQPPSKKPKMIPITVEKTAVASDVETAAEGTDDTLAESAAAL